MLPWKNSGHDTDANGLIDGLELYKAIHHAKSHKESHNHLPLDNEYPPGVPHVNVAPPTDTFELGSEDQGAVGNKHLSIEHQVKFKVVNCKIINYKLFHICIGFVDHILSKYDQDDDGQLSFIEFFASYEEAKDQLKIN